MIKAGARILISHTSSKGLYTSVQPLHAPAFLVMENQPSSLSCQNSANSSGGSQHVAPASGSSTGNPRAPNDNQAGNNVPGQAKVCIQFA